MTKRQTHKRSRRQLKGFFFGHRYIGDVENLQLCYYYIGCDGCPLRAPNPGSVLDCAMRRCTTPEDYLKIRKMIPKIPKKTKIIHDEPKWPVGYLQGGATLTPERKKAEIEVQEEAEYLLWLTGTVGR